MEEKSKPNFKVSEKIEAGLNYIELARLFLLELKDALIPYWQKAVSKSKEECQNVSEKWTVWDTLFGLFSAFLIGASVLVIFSGFAILFYQAFIWLQSGMWEELPLLVAFNYVFQDTALQQWIQNPESWLGLHQITAWILENVPISLTLMIEGALMGAFFAACVVSAVFFRYYTLKKH